MKRNKNSQLEAKKAKVALTTTKMEITRKNTKTCEKKTLRKIPDIGGIEWPINIQLPQTLSHGAAWSSVKKQTIFISYRSLSRKLLYKPIRIENRQQTQEIKNIYLIPIFPSCSRY